MGQKFVRHFLFLTFEFIITRIIRIIINCIKYILFTLMRNFFNFFIMILCILYLNIFMFTPCKLRQIFSLIKYLITLYTNE